MKGENQCIDCQNVLVINKMKREIKNIALSLSLVVVAFAIFACGKKEETKEIKVKTETTVNADVVDDADSSTGDIVIEGFEDAERVGDFLFRQKDVEGNVTSLIVLADKDFGVKKFVYNAIDLEPNYDDIAALTINFDEKVVPDGAENLISEDEENVTIKAGGIYVLKGTLKNKRIKIVEGTGKNVQIVLNGFKMETDKDSAILLSDNCLAQIFLAEGSINEISVKKDPKVKKDTDNNAVIYAKDALVFNGKGKLIVNCDFDCSIQSAEKITFISGDYVLNTKGDAIKAKKEVIFREGNFDITSGDDAIKSTSNKNACIYLENANIRINSNDKGLSSDDELIIAGGNIDIKSTGESVGGKTVNIIGGKINLVSGDDGINAGDAKQDKKSNQTGVYIRVMGGEINIDSVMDGIDSNGDLYLDGGKLFINGSANENDRIIDYNGKATCNFGLEMIGIGPGAKMQDLGERPGQSYIVVYYKEMQNASDKLELKDANGNVILTHTPSKNFNAALITSANLEAGETYKIVTGEKELIVELKAGKNEVWE